MIYKFLRTVMAMLGGLLGYGVFALARYLIGLENIQSGILSDTEVFSIGAFFVILFAFIFFRLTPAFTRRSKRAADNIDVELRGVSTQDMIFGIVGLIVGFLIAALLARIYSLIEVPWLSLMLTIMTYLVMGFLGVTVATKKQSDFIQTIQNLHKSTGQPSTGKGKKVQAVPKILDTSVIIDGRIADIMKTGIIEGRIVIPEFVLVELRHIADSSDKLKRQRGRRGLDILNTLQEEHGIEIYNTDSEKALADIPEVDVKLLKLAQIMNGRVVTNDFNLNKVAQIKGVDVLNINELASLLKPVVLPGEQMELFLVKEGKEDDQAVAYLDDGTMIVVEGGRKHIGSTISTTVTSVLQTASGRMIFAKAE